MKIFIIYFILVIVTFFWTLYLERTTDDPMYVFDPRNTYDSGDMAFIFMISLLLVISLPSCICRTIGRAIQRSQHRLKKAIIFINEMLILFFHREKE